MFGSGIAKGLATTLGHLFKPKVTIQYPEERPVLPTGFRGLPRLVYDEDPEDLRCVACSICANACPVDVIHIETHRGDNRKLVLDRFDIEAGGCVFCGLCVEACPFEALTMMRGFELAAYNREQLLWTKEMLAIKATPQSLADMERIHGPNEKEEKKEAAAAAPAAKPAAAVANGAAKPVPAKPAPAKTAAPADGAAAPTGAAAPAAETEVLAQAPASPEDSAAPEVAATPPSEMTAAVGANSTKASETTAPAKNMSAAVPGNTGGERAAEIADAEPEPPRAEVSMPPEGAGQKPEPGAPPGPGDSPSQAPGPEPATTNKR
jgi:NADH-quinone oxidoreductase subunit I